MKKLILTISICLAMMGIAGGIEARMLTFQPPVERANNTPITADEIAGYKFYYGPATGEYTQSFAVSNTVTSFDFSPEFDTYGAMTTIDTGDRESGYSNEILIAGAPVIVPAEPMPPINFVVVYSPVANTYTLQWDYPTTDVNGNPVEISKTFLFKSTDGGPSAWVADVPKGQTAYILRPGPGVHVYTLEVESMEGLGSVRSTTVTIIILASPMPPVLSQ